MLNTLNRRLIAPVLGAILLLTGCITIEENYTFNKDGSGALEFVIDASEFFKTLEGLPGKDDKSSGGNDDGFVKKEVVDQLNAIPGISKVKMKEEGKGAVQRVSLRFKDVAALNKALTVLMPDSANGPVDRFRWEGNDLVRTNNAFAAKIGDGVSTAPSDTSGEFAILQSMHYKYSFKFAQEIAGMQQAEGVAKETKGSKEVHLSTDFGVISKDPKALDLRISLK